VELKGGDFWSYSHKIESVYENINKAYLSVITKTNIFSEFYPRDGGENRLA